MPAKASRVRLSYSTLPAWVGKFHQYKFNLPDPCRSHRVTVTKVKEGLRVLDKPITYHFDDMGRCNCPHSQFHSSECSHVQAVHFLYRIFFCPVCGWTDCVENQWVYCARLVSGEVMPYVTCLHCEAIGRLGHSFMNVRMGRYLTADEAKIVRALIGGKP